jgi:hypothetical protein
VSDDDAWAVTVATQVRVAAAAATRGVAAWRRWEMTTWAATGATTTRV